MVKRKVGLSSLFYKWGQLSFAIAETFNQWIQTLRDNSLKTTQYSSPEIWSPAYIN